jgi:hypothetical protein
MRKKAFIGALAMSASLLLATSALAATESEDFDDWTPSTPLAAEQGWSYTYGAARDVELVDDGINGTNSVRISNKLMDGAFGDWLYSKPVAPAATENGSQVFTAEFDIASTSPDEQQNLQISVSPQTSGGARMSFLKFADSPEGIKVSFADVLNLDEDIVFQDSPFRQVDIATLADRDATHHVKLVMNLFPGAHNDVVQVYIDGSAGLVPGQPVGATFDGFYAPVDNQPTINKAKAGQTIPLKWRLEAQSFATSWEDYYRYDKESNGGTGVADPADLHLGYGTRQVDSLIFQARCASQSVCSNGNIADDGGFLIDNVSTTSATLTAENTLPVASAGVGDPSVYNNPPITVTGANASECAPTDGDIDTIEVYAANAGGLMYHGNGVWQYNWQTPKSLAGKCVEVALSPASLDGSTLFKLVK